MTFPHPSLVLRGIHKIHQLLHVIGTLACILKCTRQPSSQHFRLGSQFGCFSASSASGEPQSRLFSLLLHSENLKKENFQPSHPFPTNYGPERVVVRPSASLLYEIAGNELSNVFATEELMFPRSYHIPESLRVVLIVVAMGVPLSQKKGRIWVAGASCLEET